MKPRLKTRLKVGALCAALLTPTLALTPALANGHGQCHANKAACADGTCTDKDQTACTDGTCADKTARREQELLPVSQHAKVAMHAVRGARLALFNGSIPEAKQRLQAAKLAAEAAREEANEIALEVKDPTIADDAYVPLDAQLAIGESYVPTKQGNEAIQKAGQQLQAGNHNEAISMLKVAEVEVVYSTALVPVQELDRSVTEAAKLLEEGKYYEANLELKRAEELVIVRTYDVDDLAPSQATPTDKTTDCAHPQPGKEAPKHAS